MIKIGPGHINRLSSLTMVDFDKRTRVNILAKKPYFFLNRDIPDPYFFLDFRMRAKRVYYSWGPGGAVSPLVGSRGEKFLYFTPENRPFGNDL